MLLFGSKIKIIKKDGFTLLECPNCNKKGLQKIGKISYFHIYNIPTFPFGFDLELKCLYCNETLSEENIDSENKKIIKREIFKKNTIVSMFLGLFIFCVLISGIVIYKQINSINDLISYPKRNSLFIIDENEVFSTDSEKRYKLLKIVEIKYHSISFVQSYNNYSDYNALNDLIKKDNFRNSVEYDNKLINISQPDLEEFAKNKWILGSYKSDN